MVSPVAASPDPGRAPRVVSQDAAAWIVLALLALVYVADAVQWITASDAWGWGDSAVHSSRALGYRAWLFQGPGFRDPTGIIPIFGYGPLFYIVAAPFLQFMSDPETALVLVTALFGALGIVGVFLSGRALAGRAAGGFAAFLLATLPLFRLHTWDAMLDVPGTSLAALTLGALLASEGLRRPGWSAVCGVAFGATVLTRWPASAGLFPVIVSAAAVCVWRNAGKHRLLGLAFSLALVPGITVGFVFAPPVPPSFMTPATVVGVVSAGALWLTLGRGGRRPIVNLAMAACLALFLAAPAFLCARREVLDTVRIHAGFYAQEEMVPGARLTGVDGVALALARGLRFWELGAVGFGLAVVGLARTLLTPQKRWIALALIAFCAGTWAFVLTTKYPVLDRWVFPTVGALVPFAGAALFFSPPRGRMRLFPAAIAAAACLLAGFSAWSWRIPGISAHVASDRFRQEIDLRREPSPPWLSVQWAFLPQPWGSALPYHAQQWSIPDAFFQTVRTCQLRIAWRVSPSALDRIDVRHAVSEFNTRLQKTCPGAISEVPPMDKDPWGAEYSAWVLVYDAQVVDLERELTAHVTRPSRFALDPSNGLITILATRGVSAAPVPGRP